MVDLTGINGWFNFSDYYDSVIERLTDGSRILEIGVFEGRSTIYLADKIRASGKKIELHCCDLFEENQIYKGDFCGIFKEHLKRLGLESQVLIHKGFSDEVLKSFPDGFFDFIFIDGDHNYSGVIKDITLGLKKVKFGGILAGHDADFDGVMSALKKVGFNFKLIGTVWEYAPVGNWQTTFA